MTDWHIMKYDQAHISEIYQENAAKRRTVWQKLLTKVIKVRQAYDNFELEPLTVSGQGAECLSAI
jgi:hypothetical protein